MDSSNRFPITTASTSAGFQSLAPELVQEISYQVVGSNPFAQLLTSQQAHDLGILRAVCKYMNDVNAPILFRHLVSVTTSNKTSTYEPPTLPSSLAEIISKYSTNITIRMEGRDSPPPEGSIELYESWLGPFLASARNVTSIHWFLGTPVPPNNLMSISKSISSLPNLQRIHLDCYHSAPLLHLSALQPLQKLSIATYPTLLRDGIDVLLANTPDLLELSVDAWYCTTCDKPPRLPDIFRKAPSGQFLRLRSLTLSGYILPYLEPIIPHLKSLRSLSITYHISTLSEEYDDDFDDSDDEDSSDSQTKTVTPSGTAHIWKSLQAASIYVSHLEVDYIEDALLDYIDNYSSLEVLKISSTFEDKYNNNDKDPTPHSSRFFRSSLAAHKDNIRELSIYLPLEVDWPVQASYLDSIGDCHHLSSLSLTLYPWTDKSSNDITFTHQLLLATQSLPHLNGITLLPRPILGSSDEKESLRISTAFQQSFDNALTSFSTSAEPDYVRYPDVTVVKSNYGMHKTDKGWRYSLV